MPHPHCVPMSLPSNVVPVWVWSFRKLKVYAVCVHVSTSMCVHVHQELYLSVLGEALGFK